MRNRLAPDDFDAYIEQMGLLKGRRPSSLEWMWASIWHRYASDQPMPLIEYRFCPERKWRFDFAWPDERVAVEIDGGAWKAGGGRHGQDGDREKLNMASAMGWLVFRYSGQMMREDAVGVVAQVARTLEARRGSGR